MKGGEASEVNWGRAEGKVSQLMFASYFLDLHSGSFCCLHFFKRRGKHSNALKNSLEFMYYFNKVEVKL